MQWWTFVEDRGTAVRESVDEYVSTVGYRDRAARPSARRSAGMQLGVLPSGGTPT
jgi:hypothetical protein